MKRLLYVIPIVVLLWSCLDDSGNYDYITPNTVEAKAFDIDTTYDLFSGDLLTIDPELSTSISDEDILYTWSVNGKVLSTEKVFNEEVYLIPGDYKFKFEVLDKVLDIRYAFAANVRVSTSLGKGWYLLCNNEGQPNLNFISYVRDTSLKLNIYENMNDELLPQGVFKMNSTIFEDWDDITSRLTFISKEGLSDMVDIDSFTGEKVKEHKDDFLSLDQHVGSYKPTAYKMNGYNACLVSNGLLYVKTESSLDGKDYLAPVLGDYQASYYLTYPNEYVTVFYDDKNKRYLRLEMSWGGDIQLRDVVFEDTSLFDPSNTGKECVFFEGYESDWDEANVLAILKDGNKYCLQVLKFKSDYDDNWNRVLVASPLFQIEFPAGVVTENSCFALNTSNENLYIATGNTIHMVSIPSQSYKTNVGTVNEEITAMASFSREVKDKMIQGLGLALSNGTNSTFVEVSAEIESFGQELSRRFSISNGEIIDLYKPKD